MPKMMAQALACPISHGIGIRMLCACAAAIAVAGCRPVDATRAPERVKVLARGETPRGLVAYYNETIPGIQSTLEIIPGSGFVVNALKHGAAELGYAQADVVYTAYRSGLGDDPTPYTNLRAIAVIQRANVVAVVRRESRYRGAADLAGARLAPRALSVLHANDRPGRRDSRRAERDPHVRRRERAHLQAGSQRGSGVSADSRPLRGGGALRAADDGCAAHRSRAGACDADS